MSSFKSKNEQPGVSQSSGQGSARQFLFGGAAEVSSEQGVALSVGGNACVDCQSLILEVADIPPITPVPQMQPWFCGLSAIGGELVAVTDLGAWCGFSPSRQSRTARLVILEDGESSYALIVDNVEGAIDLPAERRALPTDNERLGQLVTGAVTINGIVRLIVRLDALLNQESFLHPGHSV